jgi:hypothetical protein
VVTVGEKERDQQIYSVKVLATGEEIRDLPLAGIKSQIDTMMTKGVSDAKSGR